MEHADSLVLDPHKWLGVPVDAGCALVQRGDDLRDAFSLVPPYLRQHAEAPVGTFAEYGLEQTRPFRAPKTWATIARADAPASPPGWRARTRSPASWRR
jgi:aromatic-L-amino-acid/L-tryptophan decarboxylase